VPVGSVANQSVETVEALSGERGNHPLINSILKEQAGQCGYCLAGMLMRARALLAHEPAPSRAAIIGALDDHLCRCGAHVRILRAIEQAAQLGSVRA
jgi:nicotinate dehydrogenase subunit A